MQGQRLTGQAGYNLTEVFKKAYSAFNPNENTESNGVFPDGFPSNILAIMPEAQMKTLLKKLTPNAPDGGYSIKRLPPGVKKEDVTWLSREVGSESFFIRIMYDCQTAEKTKAS